VPTLERLVLRDGNPRPSWLERAKTALSAIRTIALTGSLKDPELAKLFNDGAKTTSGISVGDGAAMRHAPFWAAVTLIAGDVASLPLVLLKRRPDGGQERDPGHRLYPILHDQFNGEMSAMQGRETVLIHALASGNGFAEIERDNGGRPVALWPLLPGQVSLFRDRGRLAYRVRGGAGNDVILDKADMLHVAGPSPDGLLGYNVIQQAREALGLSIAAEQFGAAFFGNGSTFGGALSHPKTLGLESQKTLRASIDALHQGSDKAHRFLILEEGMGYVPFGVNPNDAQFLETRIHQVREVARFFKMPPSKLGDTERTFASVEQEAIAYFVSCIRPWLVRLEQEFNRKLLTAADRNIYSTSHVVEGFLRADVEKRSQFYASMLSHGAFTIDEVRKLEGLPPLPNGAGATPRVPVNTQPVNQQEAA
jgi:HK97 family phage portal protein